MMFPIMLTRNATNTIICIFFCKIKHFLIPAEWITQDLFNAVSYREI